MKVLNLKDMPPDLMKRIKMTAAMQDKTIKEFVIAALEAYLQTGGKNG